MIEYQEALLGKLLDIDLWRHFEWETREEIEDYRIIPYGIPNEIYYAILSHQLLGLSYGKGVLFPEHAEFAR